jgi:hypothetical protein
MPKPLYYEDRDVIVTTIMELVDARIAAFKFEWQIKDNGMRLTPVDEFWDDELLNNIDNLFDAYSMGEWRNYN